MPPHKLFGACLHKVIVTLRRSVTRFRATKLYINVMYELIMRYLEEEWEMRLATQTLPLLSHMVLPPGSITQIYIYIYIGPPRTSLPLTGLPLIRHTDGLYWIALHFLRLVLLPEVQCAPLDVILFTIRAKYICDTWRLGIFYVYS